MAKNENSLNPKISVIPTSLFDHKLFPLFVGVAILLVLFGLIYFVDIFPDYSHLKIRFLSGSVTGNYYEKVEEASGLARKRSGIIENIPTNGSIDNIERLGKSSETGSFALIQDGLPQAKGLQLVAYLSSPETMFFLGPDADKIKSLADLRNARIGIGPRGSGSAHVAELLFSISKIKPLNVKLSYHTVDEQIDLLRKRKLDLGLFIIREKAAFIEKAVAEYRLQIADLRQVESISQRLPFLQPGIIPQGFYDPVANLPSVEKKVLKVSTLLVTTGKARRSEIIGLLSIMSELHPGLINYNRSNTNWSGLTMGQAASDFFNNQGPEILDRYAPRLMDLIPVSSIVQFIMAFSVLFNIMGAGNRFRLWRIDANRVSIEADVTKFFGAVMLPDEIAGKKPEREHKGKGIRTNLDAIIQRFEDLENRCRTQSQSFLVPMGAEMSYRYQEEIISRNLAALKLYRERLN